MTYYITTLLVFLGVDLLAVWGLNVQYGFCGVANLAFILFQSVGAYTAAILSLGPSGGAGGFQQYFFGASLPFPLPILCAGVAGALLGILCGLLARRVGQEYFGILTFVLAVAAALSISSVTSFLNGANGLATIPQPLQGSLGLSSQGYGWFFVGVTAVLCLLALASVRLLGRSPLGRAMRAIREDAEAATSLGKDVATIRTFALAYGGFLAGISGALLVSFIGAWSPASWGYAETLVAFSAIIVGGRGNNFGVFVGVFLLLIVITQLPPLLPAFQSAELLGPVQGLITSFLALGFLFARPQGLFPERKISYDVGQPETRGRLWRRMNGLRTWSVTPEGHV